MQPSLTPSTRSLLQLHMSPTMSTSDRYQATTFDILCAHLLIGLIVNAKLLLVAAYMGGGHFAVAASPHASSNSRVPDYHHDESSSRILRGTLQNSEFGLLAKSASQSPDPPGNIQFQDPGKVNEISSKSMITKTRRGGGGGVEGQRNWVSRRQLSNQQSPGRQQEVDSLSSFKATISRDPLKTLESWRGNDSALSPCSWEGVVCSSSLNSTDDEHVISLNLHGRQLVGNINSALLALGSGLQSLQRLDLSGNAFSGSMSEAAAAALLNCSSRFSYLNLSHNHVSGGIPFLIGALVNLETLDFESNNLTQEIPVSIANCTMLRTLNLGTNSLQGHIPQEFGTLSRLRFLNLGTPRPWQPFLAAPVFHNSISGTIPTSLSNCSSLRYLNLMFNPSLEGQIPPELGQLQSLQVLSVSGCSLSGVIPSWIGNLTDLTEIRLTGNEFYGEMPDTFGRLQHLTVFYVGVMDLRGEFPRSIFNSTMLTWLSLQRNKLSGVMPSQLGSLSNLKYLYLNGNSFTGVIPSSLSNCSLLTEVQLNDNPRMDPQIIPSWFGSLSYLEILTISNMNLGSGIPDDLGKLSNLNYLDLGRNDLIGGIPSSLANCTLVDTLWLQSNNLTGEIPPDLGALTNLIKLDLSGNILTGSLPLAITNLTHLQDIQMGNNSLHGTVPDSWALFSELQIFRLGNNQFSGPIPETLTNCSNLLNIDLADNKFSDEIHPSFGNLSRLEQFVLSNNQIRGFIPVDLIRCSRLGVLDLGKNKLTGIPLFNMGALSSLQRLYLSNNEFTGSMSESFSNYSRLLVLDLSHNQLSGNLPGNSISKMSGLISLNLSHNFFFGSWPQQLNSLEVIQEIDVSANNLSGSISGLGGGDWTALVRLDISINGFSGVIPEALASVPALSFFNASYNSFEGAIPDTGAFGSHVTANSFLGNPELCGVILGASRHCVSRNLTADESCEGGRWKCKRILWTATISAGLGVVLLLMVVGISCWIARTKGFYEKRQKGTFDLILNFDSHVRFSKSDVLKIINGSGGKVVKSTPTSVVYKGSFFGSEIFAIKTLQLGSSEGRDNDRTIGEGQCQLAQEAQILAKLHHRNILKVWGFCSISDGTKAMIMDYMPHGSLHDHLYPSGGVPACTLSWQARFTIACDVVEGLKYLHCDFSEPLIHGDLKPSNILLDDDFVAKIADFGLSKFVNRRKQGEATASSICGTVGYMPPEYAVGARISTKGDVYSLGIVLLELMTGRRPIGSQSEEFGPEENYRSWALESSWKVGIEMLDQVLKVEAISDSVKREQMLHMLRVALLCTGENPRSRPSVDALFLMLMQIAGVGKEHHTRKTIEELANEDANLAASYGLDIGEIQSTSK